MGEIRLSESLLFCFWFCICRGCKSFDTKLLHRTRSQFRLSQLFFFPCLPSPLIGWRCFCVSNDFIEIVNKIRLCCCYFWGICLRIVFSNILFFFWERNIYFIALKHSIISFNALKHETNFMMPLFCTVLLCDIPQNLWLESISWDYLSSCKNPPFFKINYKKKMEKEREHT